MKPAQVRFYFDADVLGLGKLLAGIRPDITYRGDPGAVIHKRHRPPCPIGPADDEDWVPQAAAQGWLIITRDSQIQQHRAEVAAVRDSSARMVALAGDSAGNLWDQLELVMSRWRDLEDLLELPGPFIYNLSLHGGLRKLSLDIPVRPPRRKSQASPSPSPIGSAVEERR